MVPEGVTELLGEPLAPDPDPARSLGGPPAQEAGVAFTGARAPTHSVRPAASQGGLWGRPPGVLSADSSGLTHLLSGKVAELPWESCTKATLSVGCGATCLVCASGHQPWKKKGQELSSRDEKRVLTE